VSNKLHQSALDYHKNGKPGKFEIKPTKPLANQRDLALAYSPGVAVPCLEIAKDPSCASDYTTRSNLVAVITNGTAVLGLGDIGPLAAKPVMEGKAVLFKKFAGIDGIDLEINEKDPDKLVDIIASLEPTFGAINLEDIKAPECFIVEKKLKERVNIPIFHDDQHGTAIIVGATVLNGLKLVGKAIEDVKLVCSGAGAAAMACVDLLVSMGLKSENVLMVDATGVIYKGREKVAGTHKEVYAAPDASYKTLEEAMEGADIFLGLSIGGALKGPMIKKMADQPLILALANPNPEIDPDLAKSVRPDAIIATGRSDFPNQVNNVLCFPFIFRGALDVGATEINMEMKKACVEAIAHLAKAEVSDVVSAAYPEQELRFSPEYIIPKPFDPRLIVEIAPAVAKAAMETGIATRPIQDMEAYKAQLNDYVFSSNMAMRPVFVQAKSDPKRVCFCEGEDPRVLQAIQIVVDEKLAYPIIIGRREVVLNRMKALGLRLKIDRDYELVDPQYDPRYREYWQGYHKIMERKGVTPDDAKLIIRTHASVIAGMMLERQETDALLCGPVGSFSAHLSDIEPLVGLRPDIEGPASMNILVADQGTFFFCDPYVNDAPTSHELVQTALLAAEHVRQFGIEPKVAFLSHSNFGTSSSSSAKKMREALTHLHKVAPDLEVEGEMHADAALCSHIRHDVFPNSKLQGQANLFIMPNRDAANITFNMAKGLTNGQSIGPILLGMQNAAHILTSSARVRSIVNMTAVAVADAQRKQKYSEDDHLAKVLKTLKMAR